MAQRVDVLRLQLQMAEHVERIGKRIRYRREELKLSQGALARKMPGSTDASQISRWERGVHEPEPENREALAGALKVSPEYFYVDPPEKMATPDLLSVRSNGNGAGHSTEGDLSQVLDLLAAIRQQLNAARAERADLRQRLETVESLLRRRPNEETG